jgi:hypothetical protein
MTKRDQVRIRVAFASNDGNIQPDPYDGFAFDNIFVGEKKRTVLVEHFTNNGSEIAKSSNNVLDALYDAQTPAKMAADFFKLQYHIGVPGVDELNLQNPTDPAARKFFYNISQARYDNGWNYR